MLKEIVQVVDKLNGESLKGKRFLVKDGRRDIEHKSLEMWTMRHGCSFTYIQDGTVLDADMLAEHHFDAILVCNPTLADRDTIVAVKRAGGQAGVVMDEAYAKDPANEELIGRLFVGGTIQQHLSGSMDRTQGIVMAARQVAAMINRRRYK